MDAYSESMIRLSNARLSEMCREAARHELARSVRAASTSGRRPSLRWRRRGPSVADVEIVAAPVSLPAPVGAQEELRRSA